MVMNDSAHLNTQKDEMARPEDQADLIDFIRDRLLANETVSPRDPSRLLLTDSTPEVVESIRDRAMRQFHLTYGPRLARHRSSDG